MLFAMLDFILNIDKQLFILINSQWTAPWADVFFPGITDLHKTALFKWVGIPLIFLLFIWQRGFKKGALIFIFCLSGVLASDGFGNYAFKKTVQRPRPAETQNLTVQVRAPFGGYSFVSNHATNMFTFAAFTSSLFPPMFLPTFAIAGLVAYSRVYSGVHFPTDVLCGGILGIFFGLLFASLCKKTLVLIDRKTEHNHKKATKI